MGQFLSHDFFQDIQPSLNPAPPPISGKEALSALRNAEFIDNYRDSVLECNNPPNASARRNQEYMPVLNSVSRKIEPSSTWPNGQVVWMNSSADGGLPHTRPPAYIFLPINIPDSALSQTLTHERIHLSQRRKPSEWQALFKTAWNMTPWYGTLPSRIRFLHRINPDLIGIPHYSWNNQWVVLSIFTSSNPKNLLETQLVWWHIPSSTIHYEPPPGWVKFFGSNPSGEHPYEIAAYLLADYVPTASANALKTGSPPALDLLLANLSIVQK